MAEELGRIEKPDVRQFEGKRKLYLVPLLFSWEGAPAEYVEKFNRYWQEVGEHIASLESKIGRVDRVYHESLSAGGEEGLKVLEKLNPAAHKIAGDRCRSGAQLEATEEEELTLESMDWERHILMGFVSQKVAKMVSLLFAEVSRKRYEYIAKRINETLKDGQAAMLVVREGHLAQFPPDIEVFSVVPPVLDEIHRWLRDRSSTDKES